MSARHHFEQNGLRRVAAVFDTRNRAYSEDWLKGFRKVFTELGGAVVAEVPFESGDTADHAALVRSMLAAKPDGLLFVSSAVDAARFAQAARETSGKAILIGVEWASTERLIELGGKAVDGMFVAQFFDRNDQATAYVGIRQAYEARFKAAPGFASIAAYDAARVVIEAMAKGGSTPLKQTLLEGGPFHGAQQPISFDRYGDARRRAFVTVIHDGKFLVVN